MIVIKFEKTFSLLKPHRTMYIEEHVEPSLFPIVDENMTIYV